MVRLLDLCEDCLINYNPRLNTADGYVDHYCAARGIENEADKLFLNQVLYGCLRYGDLLGVVIKVHLKKFHRLQSDWNKFLIVGYLSLLRLGNPLTVPQFKKLIGKYLSPPLLAEFLSELFTPENVKASYVAGWRDYYSDEYIHETLLPHIQDYEAPVKEYVKELESLGVRKSEVEESTSSSQQKSAQPPTFQEFNLSYKSRSTKGSPKKRDEDEEEGVQAIARAPRIKDGVTREIQEAIQQCASNSADKPSTLAAKVKAANRKRTEALLKQQQKLAFSMQSEQRPKTLPAAKARAEQAIQKLMTREVPRVQPRATSVTSPAPKSTTSVKSGGSSRRGSPMQTPPGGKLTLAAVLREDEVYRRQQEAEMAIIRRKEIELGDDTAFLAWKREQERLEAEARTAAIARRKVEAMICDENAREARQKQAEENLHHASAWKAQMATLREQWSQERQEEERRKAAAAAETSNAIKAALTKAKQELTENRLQQAAEVKVQSQQNEVRLAQLLHLELLRKQEIIAEIHALEADRPNHGVYKVTLDPEYTPGTGLSIEMSLAELKRRLAEVHRARADEERTRRAQIQARKRQQQDDLQTRVQNIEQSRTKVRAQRDQSRAQRRQQREQQQQERKQREEVELLELQQKLQQKREQRQRAEAERKLQEKERRVKAQLLNADRAMMEVKRWSDIEKGLEVAAERNQARELLQQQLSQAILHSEEHQVKRNLVTKQRERRGVWQHSDSVLQEHKHAATDSALLYKATLTTAIDTEKQRKAEMIHRKLLTARAAREQAVTSLTVQQLPSPPTPATASSSLLPLARTS